MRIRFASTTEKKETWVSPALLRKPAEPPADAPFVPLFAAGAAVEVEWKRHWWPAKVLKVDAEKRRYFIHYDGYEADWDEWVGPKRIRKPE